MERPDELLTVVFDGACGGDSANECESDNVGDCGDCEGKDAIAEVRIGKSEDLNRTCTAKPRAWVIVEMNVTAPFIGVRVTAGSTLTLSSAATYVGVTVIVSRKGLKQSE